MRPLLAVLCAATSIMGLSGDHAFANRRGARAESTRVGLRRRRSRVNAHLPVPYVPSATVSASAPPVPSVSADPAASELEVDKYEDPLVIEPPPREGPPYAVVIALHGLNSTPESLCDPLRGAIGSECFVLCPVGTFSSYEDGKRMYQFLGPESIWDEAEAGLDALSDHYGHRVDVKHPIYLGFSQGSIMGAEVVVHEGDIERAIFVEGGQDTFVRSHVEAFERHGGKRVLYVTGSDYWETRARASVPEFDGTKVDILHVHVQGEGHHFSPKIVENLAARLEWLTVGDSRFVFETFLAR